MKNGLTKEVVLSSLKKGQVRFHAYPAPGTDMKSVTPSAIKRIIEQNADRFDDPGYEVPKDVLVSLFIPGTEPPSAQ